MTLKHIDLWSRCGYHDNLKNWCLFCSKTGTFYLRANFDDVNNFTPVEDAFTPADVLTTRCMAAYSIFHDLFSQHNPFVIPQRMYSVQNKIVLEL